MALKKDGRPRLERATLLEKAEKTMPPEDKLSPLEKRARERWLQMVREG